MAYPVPFTLATLPKGKMISWSRNGIPGDIAHARHVGHVKPATWEELRAYVPTGNLAKDKGFLRWFHARMGNDITILGCACRQFFKQVLASNPVRWDDYPAWALEAEAQAKRLRMAAVNNAAPSPAQP